MICKCLNVEQKWVNVNLTDEFNNSILSKFKFLLNILSVLPEKYSNIILIYIQCYFLDSLYKKFKKCTFGGFLENRVNLIGFLEDEKNNMIHLGIDINNLKAGCDILSPCDGKVIHVMKDETKINGWGGRVIIEMEKEWNGSKYLLLGHLSLVNLPKIGDSILKGEKIGVLGNTNENGGWFPHLHIQCIKEKFYKMFEKNLEKLDGYWFDEENFLDFVSDPTELIFEEI